MDVLGYVRTLAWGPATETEPEPQEEAIHRWAEGRGHRIVAFLHDELAPGSDDLERRLGLAKALGMLRDGMVKAMVVARLDRLAEDVVLQERLISEIAAGGSLFAADPDEEVELGAPPAGSARAMVRRVLVTAGDYERARRELRIGQQVARTKVPRDRQQAAMALIDALARDGATLEEIATTLRTAGFTPRSGSLFTRSRLRRLLNRHVA